MLSFARTFFDAARPGMSLDQEDRIYADGFAAGESGKVWAPRDLDAVGQRVWTEGYRDGRHGQGSTGGRSMRQVRSASFV